MHECRKIINGVELVVKVNEMYHNLRARERINERSV